MFKKAQLSEWSKEVDLRDSIGIIRNPLFYNACVQITYCALFSYIIIEILIMYALFYNRFIFPNKTLSLHIWCKATSCYKRTRSTNIFVRHIIIPTIVCVPLKTPEKFIGPFLKIGHTQPCPFLKSDPKSFP